MIPVAAVCLAAASGLANVPSRQFTEGQAAYAEHCAVCHGETGRGGPGFANSIWGQGARISKFRTAAELFEYHQLMMPFDDPSRVSDEVKWAVTLYLLANHGTVAPSTTLDAATAGSIAIR
jgi:cytochrome c